MKTKNKKETTIGIDLGDKKHDAYALSNDGELISRHEVTNTKPGLKELTDRINQSEWTINAITSKQDPRQDSHRDREDWYLQ